MMFDAMCRAAEAIGGRFEQQMRMASLLVSERSESLVPKEGDARVEAINRWETQFRTLWPYMVVDWGRAAVFISRLGCSRAPVREWVEDWGSLVRPNDVDQGSRIGTGSIGIESGDVFLVAKTTESPDGHTYTGIAEIAIGPKRGPEYVHGTYTRPDRFWLAVEDRFGMTVGSTADLWRFLGQERVESMVQELQVAWIGATLRLLDAADAGNWILSKGRENERDPTTSKKIPRSHQRRHYIVISDAERRRVFRESPSAPDAGERASVTPHARRAHYRHIGENEDGSKRYTWVRACWVGSIEAEIRGAKYRVELDL